MHTTYTGVSFARDFLEIEQNRRSDINFAYDITEFTSKFGTYIVIYCA